jgi:hypothetical protein
MYIDVIGKGLRFFVADVRYVEYNRKSGVLKIEDVHGEEYGMPGGELVDFSIMNENGAIVRSLSDYREEERGEA